jgi:PPP family 3-phenylpropionic acid transporter
VAQINTRCGNDHHDLDRIAIELMPLESVIPTASRQFARRLSLFYGTLFGLNGTHLPFFPVWLRAIGLDPSWIGVIIAVPAVTRFTVLPVITGLAESRHALRGALRLTAFAAALGFAVVGTQHWPIPLFLLYVVTCCLWTPMVPLTDAYALRGVVRYGLDYGRLRLWGSAAFVVGALACGLLVDVIAATQLIWIIVGLAVLGAAASLALKPLDNPRAGAAIVHGDGALLRRFGFLAIIVASALIQGSHAAYYSFASIHWQAQGLGGLTIAGLWTLGVLAEILVFALSPRFTLPAAMMVVIGGVSAAVRWLITAQDPPLVALAIVQLAHGLSFGLTQVGTMGLLLRQVPAHATARGQGYYAACSGIVSSSASVVSGAIYAHYGQGVYYVMAAMAASGAVLMWSARRQFERQPQSAASGG